MHKPVIVDATEPLRRSKFSLEHSTWAMRHNPDKQTDNTRELLGAILSALIPL
jgi:hypothetical protein